MLRDLHPASTWVTMKILSGQLLFLLSILSPSLARSSLGLERGNRGLLTRDSGSLKPSSDQAAPLSPVGTKDAPIDGKDGKPHAGPFVETEAERDRKKAKASSVEEPAMNSPTGSAKEQADLRQSHDGVMDDRNRVGPKDGTRGTEGGMTEKSKEKKIGEEKRPDPPKEAPPLPHSEQEMMRDHLEQKFEKAPGDEENLVEVFESAPFVISHLLTGDGRNPPTYQANHMMYRLEKTLPLPKMILSRAQIFQATETCSHRMMRIVPSFNRFILSSCHSP